VLHTQEYWSSVDTTHPGKRPVSHPPSVFPCLLQTWKPPWVGLGRGATMMTSADKPKAFKGLSRFIIVSSLKHPRRERQKKKKSFPTRLLCFVKGSYTLFRKEKVYAVIETTMISVLLTQREGCLHTQGLLPRLLGSACLATLQPLWSCPFEATSPPLGTGVSDLGCDLFVSTVLSTSIFPIAFKHDCTTILYQANRSIYLFMV
ncbi:mCG145135, partial [Mus musculus]